MIRLPQLIAAPLSVLYGFGVWIRHKLFDLKVLRSEEFDVPVICVGNLTVGGTGKTPVTERLIEYFSGSYRVAVLSRGYGRRTKGFVLATPDTSARQIGDEPRQIKLKFPTIVVAVCERRVEGIHQLRRLHPEVDLILLDDAFQHRYVEPWASVVLMDYNRPIYRDHLLPWGALRDVPSAIDRANFVLVTKCPDDLNPLDVRLVTNSLGLYPYQSLYFTQMVQGSMQPIFPDEAPAQMPDDVPAIVLSGIANPVPFVEGVERTHPVVDTMLLGDHHVYRVGDVRQLETMLAQYPDAVILTTEKDAVKLTNRRKIPLSVRRKLYYIPVSVAFMGDSESCFIRQIEQYVRQNQKYCILHPE